MLLLWGRPNTSANPNTNATSTNPNTNGTITITSVELQANAMDS